MILRKYFLTEYYCSYYFSNYNYTYCAGYPPPTESENHLQYNCDSQNCQSDTVPNCTKLSHLNFLSLSFYIYILTHRKPKVNRFLGKNNFFILKNILTIHYKYGIIPATEKQKIKNIFEKILDISFRLRYNIYRKKKARTTK